MSELGFRNAILLLKLSKDLNLPCVSPYALHGAIVLSSLVAHLDTAKYYKNFNSLVAFYLITPPEQYNKLLLSLGQMKKETAISFLFQNLTIGNYYLGLQSDVLFDLPRAPERTVCNASFNSQITTDFHFVESGPMCYCDIHSVPFQTVSYSAVANVRFIADDKFIMACIPGAITSMFSWDTTADQTYKTDLILFGMHEFSGIAINDLIDTPDLILNAYEKLLLCKPALVKITIPAFTSESETFNANLLVAGLCSIHHENFKVSTQMCDFSMLSKLTIKFGEAINLDETPKTPHLTFNRPMLSILVSEDKVLHIGKNKILSKL